MSDFSGSMPFNIPDELDEIEDQIQEVGKLTPIEFAKYWGVAPQMIYYYIRNNVLKTEKCICGRTVLDVVRATEILQAKKEARRK